MKVTVSIKPEDQPLEQDVTPCPLCLKSDGEPSEWFETVWQEMECDATTLVRVHKYCAWQIVRDALYSREGALLEQERTGAGRGPTEAEHWIGWEPRPFLPPWYEQ